MLRQVNLPSNIGGVLFLSVMPGRYGSLEEDFKRMKSKGVTRIICLAPLDEVGKKSPDYYKALVDDKVPWPVEESLVPDRGIPEDESSFLKTVLQVADWLRKGEKVVVHCGAGIGRTGMFAMCTLAALGISPEAAKQAVRAAGSGPETAKQNTFVRRINARLKR